MEKVYLLISFVVFILLAIFKNDLVLVVNSFFTFFIAFKAISNSQKNKLLLSNFQGLFLFVFFLYGISAALVQFSFDGAISNDYYFPTLLYMMCVSSVTFGMIWNRKKKFIINEQYDINLTSKIPISPNIIFIILLGLIVKKSLEFYKQGILLNFTAFTKDRLDLFTDISQIDVIFGILTTASFLYLIFYYKKLGTKRKSLLIILISYYIVIQLLAGNRRDFMPIALGVIWVVSNFRNIKFSFKIFVGLIIAIMLFNIIAVFRTGQVITDKEVAFESSLKYNEFVFPFETLRYEVSDGLSGNSNLKLGSTILINSITIFIPREIFSGKPNSLASDFVMERFGGGIGYAYMPITEFYVNFGFLGTIVSFFFIGTFFTFLTSLSNQRFGFIMYCLIFDFCRGEISSLIYIFIITSIFLLLIPFFMKGFAKRKKLYEYNLR